MMEMMGNPSIADFQRMEDERAKQAAYERMMSVAEKKIRPAPPPHTVQGRLMALEEAMHRLINITDDMERLSAPFRTSPGVPTNRTKDDSRPSMSEVAEQIDRAADNINAIADRLMGMADGFK